MLVNSSVFLIDIKLTRQIFLLPDFTGKPGGSFIWTNSLSLLKCLKGAITSKTFNNLKYGREKKFFHIDFIVSLHFITTCLQTYSITAPISQMLKMTPPLPHFFFGLLFFSLCQVYNFLFLLCSHNFHSCWKSWICISADSAHISPPPKVYTHPQVL